MMMDSQLPPLIIKIHPNGTFESDVKTFKTLRGHTRLMYEKTLYSLEYREPSVCQVYRARGVNEHPHQLLILLSDDRLMHFKGDGALLTLNYPTWKNMKSLAEGAGIGKYVIVTTGELIFVDKPTHILKNVVKI
jgi:hypothetical protein